MSDLDTEFRDLRKVLHTTIEQPDLVNIAALARARTSRRRTQWSAAAAVLLVAAAVPLLRGDAESPAPVGEAPDRPVVTGNLFVNGIDFVTPERGFAIESNCLYSDRDDCRYDLLGTTDGGRSWTSHPLPRTEDGIIFTRFQAMYVLGENEVMIDRTTSDDRNERILSVDGGQNWSVVAEPIVAAASPTILAAGGLVSGCAPLVPDVEMRCATVATILPDGRTSQLVTQPPLEHPVPNYLPTTEGTWWVHGRDPATNDLALAVSRDEGRTWTTRSLDLPMIEWGRGNVAVAEYDGTLYASVSDYRAPQPVALIAMFVSTDGGQSWTRTREFDDDAYPRSMVGDLVVTPSGEVLVNSLIDDQKTYVTTDGGETFTEAERHFGGVVFRVHAGYVEEPWRKVKIDYAFSTDGGEWRPLTVG